MITQTKLFLGILICACCCFVQFAKAQLVYTNVNPDSFLACTYSCSSQCNLDIDKDGINDFYVKVFTSPCGLGNPQNHYVTCGALGSNQILIVNEFPAMLNLNDAIGQNAFWGSGGTLRSMTFCPSIKYAGNWLSSGFLALKLVNGGATFYGWLHLGVIVGPGSASATIFDYAYNSISGQPLLAGQTCPPQSQIIANGPTTFCEGDSVIIFSANSGTNLSYRWKLNGANISGATNKEYTAKLAGKYKVKVTDTDNECTSTSAAVKVKTPCRMMSIDMNEAEISLTAYPNPISSSATISYSISLSENVSLRVFDAEGRLIRTLANGQISEGTHTLTWNARDENGNLVSDGIYFLCLLTEQEMKTMTIALAR